MATIADALRRIKGKLTEVVPPSLPERIARDLGLDFRRRTLTPAATTFLFLQQVLHGNTAVGELRHLAGVDFTDSAYCQARGRLPVGFFRRLAQAVTDRCRATEPARSRWRGHRVFLADGSSFSMPDTQELAAAFGQPTGQAKGCGFPVAHLLVEFDAHAGYLLKAVPAPLHTHDLRHAAVLHRELGPGDVLVGDRAFGSYAHLALLRGRRLHGLFRAHQRTIVDFRPHRRHAEPGRSHRDQAGLPRSRWLARLGKHDQRVEYHKPAEKPAWMTDEAYRALPETLVVREIRVKVRQPGRRVRELTLVTTLTDAGRYPAQALARLYAKRWQAEVNLRHLKQTLKMDVLRCQTFVGICKELYVFVAIYNLVRRVMAEAAGRQEVEPDRVSFVDALRWLRHARPGDELPRLKVNPVRERPTEPRVRKRRPKGFPLMTKPREQLRQELAQQEHAP